MTQQPRRRSCWRPVAPAGTCFRPRRWPRQLLSARGIEPVAGHRSSAARVRQPPARGAVHHRGWRRRQDDVPKLKRIRGGLALLRRPDAGPAAAPVARASSASAATLRAAVLAAQPARMSHRCCTSRTPWLGRANRLLMPARRAISRRPPSHGTRCREDLPAKVVAPAIRCARRSPPLRPALSAAGEGTGRSPPGLRRQPGRARPFATSCRRRSPSVRRPLRSRCVIVQQCRPET
jgi:hypothetical protein